MTVVPTNYYQGISSNERFTVPDTTPVIVSAAGGEDYIFATNLGDLLYGGLADDVIFARNGDDTIYGDLFPGEDGGNDQIHAGTGNDVAYGGAGEDYVNAGDGNDIVNGDDGDDYLLGGLGADVISGGAGDDFLFGNGVVSGGPLPLLGVISVDIDGITGDPLTQPDDYGGEMGELPLVDDNASDTLYGGVGRDAAWGFGGDDNLYGGSGNDSLTGGLGRDHLVGGADKDQFVFAEYGRNNFDVVEDFHKGDQFALAVTKFKGIGNAGGKLSKKYFEVGKEAKSGNDHIIYDKGQGKLYYDADGDGKAAMKIFATVEKGTGLSASDFILI
jgi:Ca2+-binding RTX toxin-like protein